MSVWTKERLAQVKALWRSGLSASQVAEIVGFTTRNGILGKLHRIGAAKRGLGQQRPVARGPRLPRKPVAPRQRPAVARRPMRRAVAITLPPPMPKVEPMESAPSPDAPPPLMLSLLDLSPQTCKWPVGDPIEADFGFCGHPPIEGKPYCDHHYRRSIGSGTPSEQNAIRSARAAARAE